MTKRLYVGNLPYSTNEAQLRALFSPAGEIANVTLITDRETGRSKGFGFVEMATEEGARELIKRFNGYTMEKRSLTVNEARPRDERPKEGGNRGAYNSGGSGDGGGRSSYGGGDKSSYGGSSDRNTYSGDRNSSYSSDKGGYGSDKGSYGNDKYDNGERNNYNERSSFKNKDRDGGRGNY